MLHKKTNYTVVILVIKHVKKRPLQAYFPDWPTLLAIQGDGKVNGFLTKPISPLWAEIADKRHQFPDILLIPCVLSPFLFPHIFQKRMHAKGTSLKLWWIKTVKGWNYKLSLLICLLIIIIFWLTLLFSLQNVRKIEKNVHHAFLKLKVTCSNSFFCQSNTLKPKEPYFTMTKKNKQKVLTFEKLESANVNYFSLINECIDESAIEINYYSVDLLIDKAL